MSEQKYYDIDGNDLSLYRLVRKEPDWAESRIRESNKILAAALKEQRQRCWHKAQHFLRQAGAWDCMQGVRDACLNTTGESDG